MPGAIKRRGRPSTRWLARWGRLHSLYGGRPIQTRLYGGPRVYKISDGTPRYLVRAMIRRAGELFRRKLSPGSAAVITAGEFPAHLVSRIDERAATLICSPWEGWRGADEVIA